MAEFSLLKIAESTVKLLIFECTVDWQNFVLQLINNENWTYNILQNNRNLCHFTVSLDRVIQRVCQVTLICVCLWQWCCTFSSESRAFCGFMFFPLRDFISSLLITGSLSCSSHDHIRLARTRGSLSIHSFSHAPSLEFSSVCRSQQRALWQGMDWNMFSISNT